MKKVYITLFILSMSITHLMANHDLQVNYSGLGGNSHKFLTLEDEMTYDELWRKLKQTFSEVTPDLWQKIKIVAKKPVPQPGQPNREFVTSENWPAIRAHLIEQKDTGNVWLAITK